MKYLKAEKEALGSHFIVELVDDSPKTEEILNSFWTSLALFQQKFSRFDKNSELFKLNSRPGEWQKVSKQFWSFLLKTEKLKKLTNGYFAIEIGGILNDLGYDLDYSFERKSGKLESIALELDKKNRKIKIGSLIDFGGFGKGYALDLAAKIFKDIAGVCVNAGGDFFVKGHDQKGEKWKIYFENPLNALEAIGFGEFENVFLASSNANKRRWKEGHHLINPHLAMPANQMEAVFVQGNNGVLVDALSTALFVMGFEKAQEFLLNNPLVEAMLIAKNLEIWRTTGFKGELFSK